MSWVGGGHPPYLPTSQEAGLMVRKRILEAKGGLCQGLCQTQPLSQLLLRWLLWAGHVQPGSQSGERGRGT